MQFSFHKSCKLNLAGVSEATWFYSLISSFLGLKSKEFQFPNLHRN